MNSKEQQRQWWRQKGVKMRDAEYVERWFTEAWARGGGGWIMMANISSVQVNCYARASTLSSGWRTGEGKRGVTLSKSTAIKVKVRIPLNLIKCPYLHSRPLKGQSTVGDSQTVVPVLSIINELHFQFCTHWFQYVVHQFKALLEVCKSKKAVISWALCTHCWL